MWSGPRRTAKFPSTLATICMCTVHRIKVGIMLSGPYSSGLPTLATHCKQIPEAPYPLVGLAVSHSSSFCKPTCLSACRYTFEYPSSWKEALPNKVRPALVDSVEGARPMGWMVETA